MLGGVGVGQVVDAGFRETTVLGGGCGQCCEELHQPMYVNSGEGSGGKVAWMMDCFRCPKCPGVECC